MVDTMTRTISTHEATVHTAAVEVKTLTIRGKQVTLSVFRQLKDEPLIDAETGDLRGVPWGTVNYFWGDCTKRDTHLHVVWQRGDELRRACVYRQPSPGAPGLDRLVDELGWAVISKAVALLHAGKLNPDWVKASVHDGYIVWNHGRYDGSLDLLDDLCTLARGNQVRSYDDIRAVLEADPRHQAATDALHEAEAKRTLETDLLMQDYGGPCREVWSHPAYLHAHNAEHTARNRLYAIDGEIKEKIQRHDAMTAAAAWLEGDTDPAAWAERVTAAASACDAFLAKWAQHYDTLAALPQLFIAV